MASIFCPLKLHQTKYVETTSNFHVSKLHWTSSSKRRGNLLILSFQRFDVVLTLNQYRFDVLCPLGTLSIVLSIVPPVVIRFRLFESQRPKNPVKPTMKCSEKVTINQLVIRGTGQTFFKQSGR